MTTVVQRPGMKLPGLDWFAPPVAERSEVTQFLKGTLVVDLNIMGGANG